MIRLTKQQILLMHKELVAESGGDPGLRDEAMLDSALNAPFQTFDGDPLYPSLQSQAARLGYCLIENHPFLDGNKRIGAHAMLVFLTLNGVELQYDEQELIDMILAIAAGKKNYEKLLEWVGRHQNSNENS